MQDLSARLEQFDSWNNLNNLTVCKILENKLAICKTTQDLFVRALPHQCNVFQKTYTLTQKQSNKSIDCMLPI